MYARANVYRTTAGTPVVASLLLAIAGHASASDYVGNAAGYATSTLGNYQFVDYQTTNALRQRFIVLVREWRDATMATSSLTDIVLHPAYQRIIGMGPAALPLIYEELEKSVDHWDWALQAITGRAPIPEKRMGDLEFARETWLAELLRNRTV